MKKTAIGLALILAIGCGENTNPGLEAARGRLKWNLFKQCMEMTSKLPRAGDDDVADVVEECRWSAGFMSEQMLPDEEAAKKYETICNPFSD